MLKLILFVILVSVPISYACELECTDNCYVKNDGDISSDCNLIIDEGALISAGLSDSETSTILEITLSGVVTKLNFVLLIPTDDVGVTLVSDENVAVKIIQLNGPFILADDFFREFTNLDNLAIRNVIFSDFPIFRFNFKMVTLECVDIEVSSGATDISWSFIAGLDSLTSVNFICEAQVNAENSPSAFVGLDSLTKIEFDQVDFSVALPSVFETLTTLVEVSLTNAGILNLDLIAPDIREGILKLDLTSNSIDEQNIDNFDGFVNLTILILADNGYTKLERALFQEMQLLDTLDLSGNQIRSISTDTFYTIPTIRSVKIVNSLITTLDYSILAPLVNLTLFALDGNPLRCDCDTFWVARFYEDFDISFESESNANCATPGDQLNNKVYSLDTYESCNQNYSCFCVSSGSSLGCDGYECLVGLPPTNATTAEVTNTTTTTTTTMAPEVKVPLTEQELIVIFGLLGFFALFILALIVGLSLFVFCCCCLGGDDGKPAKMV